MKILNGKVKAKMVNGCPDGVRDVIEDMRVSMGKWVGNVRVDIDG